MQLQRQSSVHYYVTWSNYFGTAFRNSNFDGCFVKDVVKYCTGHWHFVETNHTTVWFSSHGVFFKRSKKYHYTADAFGVIQRRFGSHDKVKQARRLTRQYTAWAHFLGGNIAWAVTG